MLENAGNLAGTSRVGLALSEDGVAFPDSTRRLTPVLFPEHDAWQGLEWQGGIEDPRVIERDDGLYVMTYTSYNGVARLCAASSWDLLTWEKHGPVFADAHGGAFVDAWTKVRRPSHKCMCSILMAAVLGSQVGREACGPSLPCASNRHHPMCYIADVTCGRAARSW